MRFNLDNYETVETRLAKFWAQYPNGQVFTAIHHYDDNKVVFRAEIYKDISDPRPVATGYAEEVRDLSPVNKTSHVENAETSAIGRALANFIFQSKTAPRPSREEMSKVARAEQPKPQGQDLLTKFREACAKQNIDPQDVAKAAGLNFGELTDADMPKLRDAFKTLANAPKPAPVVEAEAFIDKVKEVFPTAAKVDNTPQIKDPDSPATKAQVGKIRAMMSGKGIASYQDKIEKAQELLSDPGLQQLERLTKGQANLLINMIEEMK
jgi:hypothetical protein